MTSYFDTVLQFLGFIFSPMILMLVLIIGAVVALIHLPYIPGWRTNKPIRVFFVITYISGVVFLIPFLMWLGKNFYLLSWTVRP